MPPLDRTIELTKLIQSRISECDAMKTKMLSENRQFTEEEMTKYGTFLGDIEVYTAELELEKREASARDRLNQSSASRVMRPDGTILDELQARYPGLPPKEQRFENVGENVIAMRQAALQHRVDPRLRAAASGMGENTPSDGGFLVQQDFSTNLLDASYKPSPIVAGVRKMSLSANSNGIKLPMVKETNRGLSTLYGALAMYWLGEGDLISSGSVKFRQVELAIKKVAALIPLTDELVQDSTALASFITSFFPGALSSNLERVIVRGSGVGQPLGILNSGCLISIDKEDGQLADTIDGMNIIKMFARMWASGMGSAVWMMSQSILPQLINMSLPGFPNIPLWLPPNGLAGSPYGSLMGRPLYAIEHCSKLGDQGDIIFADLNSYLLVDKGGPQNAISAEYRFPYDEQMLRMVYRCDGQPLYVSAITPADASDSIGPFITLDERA